MTHREPYASLISLSNGADRRLRLAYANRARAARSGGHPGAAGRVDGLEKPNLRYICHLWSGREKKGHVADPSRAPYRYPTVQAPTPQVGERHWGTRAARSSGHPGAARRVGGLEKPNVLREPRARRSQMWSAPRGARARVRGRGRAGAELPCFRDPCAGCTCAFEVAERGV